MASSVERRQIFYTNLRLLGFDTHPTRITVNKDMFKLPNKAGFEMIAHFLFERLNPRRAREEFRDCWPVSDKKREQMFRRMCNGWLSQIAQDEADAHLPKIVPSIFQSPGGERFCHLMFAFSTYVLTQVLKNEHGVKPRDMMLKPSLSPQNLELASAMERGVQSAVIAERKKFFDAIQTRDTLHKTWQKSASSMLTEYRKLSRDVRQREADIKSLRTEKGIRSPIRMDGSKKHNRLFDVNIESVKREEKIQKVRSLWRTVEEFLSSTEKQQAVVSSILSGVIHKYILNAGELDLRVPEMLLRECERELLKRDIGNTYKAGKLDLVSILNLWNLSIHLYLERLEDSDKIDLSEQLADIQPKLQGLNAQLSSTRQLADSLKDELLPELKESIRQRKAKYLSREVECAPPASKLGMTLQPNTPPLIFDPSKASAADIEATKMTFTPDMLAQESTPDAVNRIMKSINRSIQPRRLACADMTNTGQQTEASGSGVPQGAVLSPLAQGKAVRMRRGQGDLSSQSLSESVLNVSTSSRPNSKVEILRVGSKQMTRVVKGQRKEPVVWTEEGNVFSPDESPPDVLAARIAQSMIEAGDPDNPQPAAGVGDSDYFLSNVLEELGDSGFVKRDKIARTPDRSASMNTTARTAMGSPATFHQQFSEDSWLEELLLTSPGKYATYSPAESPIRLGPQGQSIGRRIVDDVLDEQPLFIDSPTTNLYSAGELRMSDDCDGSL